MSRVSSGAIQFAEKVLALLDDGRFSSTYKYAVLLGLLDLSLENVSRTGEPAEVFTTRQLAAKVIELYWPHAAPYAREATAEVLIQNGSSRQAEIVTAIRRTRERIAAADPSASLVQLRQREPAEFKRLTDTVERIVIDMPLPRLQRVGNTVNRFVYEWDENADRAQVRAYQRGRPSTFDNRIRLRPAVGAWLVELNALLRPLIQRHWSTMVARLNQLEEARLERFLFGADRIPLAQVRTALRELQHDACFYCRRTLGSSSHVDHFIPWSRYPEDGLANLVLAHDACNLKKRDFLPATPHVVRWAERLGGRELHELETELRWEAAVDDMRGVARDVYLRLPDDAMLWLAGADFVPPDVATLRQVLE